MNYDYDNYQWQPGMPDPMEGMDDDERIAASICDIAITLGFNNQSTFSRFFKRETGISPKDYRNNINIPFI